MKKALITGIAGQDGSYLAEFLLERDTRCTGSSAARARSTRHGSTTFSRACTAITVASLHYGDLTDTSNLIRLMQKIRPDEVYNVAAQSHVAVSFESRSTPPTSTAGDTCLLEAIRILGLEGRTKFYQAATSELYGLVQETPRMRRPRLSTEPLRRG